MLFKGKTIRRISAGSLIFAFVAIVIAVGMLSWNNVSTDLTDADRRYAALILSDAGYGSLYHENWKPDDFEDQVRAIVAVQDAVLRTAPKEVEIPLGQQREPKDLYELKQGLCFDRSRSIEKILTWLGFETRHVSIYDTEKIGRFRALITPQVPSHAVSEVLTQKGWMLVDSNARWIGLSEQREPLSVDWIQRRQEDLVAWAPESRGNINNIFLHHFIRIYGLYSCHGYFYPPFTPIPDVNLPQLASNFYE